MQRSQTHIEAEGGTTEDAIADALRRLGTHRGEVDIKIIDEGKKGFLGIGSRPARVFVSIKKRGADRERVRDGGRDRERPSDRDELRELDPQKSAEHAKEILSTMLTKMGFEASLSSRVRDGQITLSVSTPRSEGLLIGRKGETLRALEHLVTRITSRHMRERANVTVDVSGYRERRTDSLQATAREMADEVLRTGREVHTEPLEAPDRRIVHRALNGVKGVETEALGDGAEKRIVIRPSDGSERAPAREAERGDHAERGGPRAERGSRGRRGGRRRRGRRDEEPPRGDRPRERDELPRERDELPRERDDRPRERDDRPRERDDRPREPRRSDERRAPAHASRNGDQDEPAAPRREQKPAAAGEKPLDLLGTVGSTPRSEETSAEEEVRKPGIRSRRRRPARKRL